MADNYVERQYAEYVKRKAEKERNARLEYARKLKAYREKLRQRDETSAARDDGDCGGGV